MRKDSRNEIMDNYYIAHEYMKARLGITVLKFNVRHAFI